MADAKTYRGSCHCGKVRYEVETDLDQVISCNCSICSKHALVLTFVPEAKFKLLSGGDDLKEYLFNKKVIHHQICAHCGVEPFALGKPPGSTATTVAVNVRCLDGVDVGTLKTKAFDGKSL